MESYLLQGLARFRPVLWQLGGWAIWLGILPFFLLCWYAHPSADDFLQATDVSKHGHLGYFKYMYLNWTGRYTAMVGWSFLNPVSYGQTKAGYGLVCALLMLLLLVALVLLLRVLLRGAGFTPRQLWQAGAGAFLLLVYYLPNTAEYFYWLTASYNYLLPAILLLLALAILATHTAQPQPARRWPLLATAALLLLAVGCNEPLALPVLLTVWAGAAVESWRQRRLVGLAVVLAVSAGCAVSFLAPGNAGRMAVEHSASPGILKAILGVIEFTVYCLVVWLGNGLLVVVTLLLVPVFARLAKLPALPLNHLVRHPLLLTLLVPAFLAAGLFPSLWATGALAPPRALDLLYICFIGSWMLAAYAWIAYFGQRPHATTAPLRLPAFVRWTLLAWLPITFLNDYNHRLLPGYRLSTNNSFTAYRDLLSGAAARYDAELTARYRFLQTTPLAQPTVAPLTDPPLTLLFSDITTNPTDWSNLAYADFFKKKSIVTRPDSIGK
ncbi:DUF6056 family protein [Hymenobacter sp. BT770]|uniref:DUF6056 family protein n=1 Tax=Hymenobacter sp. BT770 TaxID=2886942 RepID=UPI001D11F5A6|nr:DUF6056 family protein [Hymenobacter sp. BT770]MCC3151553.1 DUF6056 family protein [Hymenobacter sp. BT770]MDO3413871.1 DUF6056 family protein [Hymenobacter sp. BT770]